MQSFGLDQNMVLLIIIAGVILLVYWLISATSRGKKTYNTIQKKERAWLTKEKKLFKKLLKYVLAPVVLFWIFVDTLFVIIANYYFHNVIFEPLLGFTPMQTLIATILLLFLGYLVYKSFINKRGGKK